MLVVSAVTLLALYFAQRRLAANVEVDLQREFQGELAAFDRAQEVRRVALVERCRALVRKSRIRGALEDDALDLLYDAAADELLDVMIQPGEARLPDPGRAPHAEFYRFLDVKGVVIPPSRPGSVGMLTPEQEERLALRGVPDRPQIGYVARRELNGMTAISEIIAMPIFSSDLGQVIAALVLGFRPFEFGGRAALTGMRSGVWLDGSLYANSLKPETTEALAREVGRATEEPVRVMIDGAPYLLFSKRLNPGSVYPPAFEACVYPLADLI